MQVQDITEQNEARINYEGLFKNKVMGLAHCKVIFNDNNEPVDFKFIDVNDIYEKYTGLIREEVIGKTITKAIPGIDQALIDMQNNVALNGEDLRYEFYEPNLERWYEINVYSPQYGEFISIFTDISQKKETEERYNEFFNNPIVGLGLCRVVVNEKGEPIDYIYLNVNDAFEEFTGLKREEIINKGVKEVLPDDADNLVSIFGPVGLTGEKIEVEVPIPTLGRIYNVSAYSPSHNHFIAIFSDITEQKNAEKALVKSKKLLQDIIDGFPSPIFVKDTGGRFLTVNKKLEALLGVKNKELKGKTDYDIITKELADYYRTNDQKVIEEGKAISIEEEADLIDGHHTFIANKFPLYDSSGEPYGVGSISIDITERKLLEEQMETTMNELRRSNEELERFAYVSSHDLQEPLRMVTLYSQLLERRYKDSLDSDADDFIEYIVENAKRMKFLIDDLLEYSRVTSQTREFENIDLEIVLEDVLSNLSIPIVENNVNVTHDHLPTVFADRNQMMQVFENLITNAIKFRGRESPKIDISAQKGEKEWIFAVKDNGIGISPKHQKQIFEVFKRLHTRDEYPGTGIGLSIAQKILERHNGRIWVKSEPGKGSTFNFTIPNQNFIN